MSDTFFHGKLIVITGASSGLGEEFARQLHASGADLLLIARRRDRLELLVEGFNTARASSAECLVADLANPEALAAIAARVGSERVDLLINNAGRGSFEYFENIAVASEQEMVALNISASIALAHAVIPGMKARGTGGILSVSSVAAFQPLPYMATYAATKSFNLSHSLGLRHELAPFGITVSVLCPGPTATEFAGVARVPGEWTSMRRDSAASVVSAALRGYRRNKAVIVPGLRSKLMTLAARLLPLDFTTPIARRALQNSLPKR